MNKTFTEIVGTLRGMIKSPRTTAIAIAAFFTVYKQYQADHSVLTEPWFWTSVLLSMNGLFTKDAGSPKE